MEQTCGSLLYKTHQGANLSPLQTTKYSLKWQLVLNFVNWFLLNVITQQEAQNIINPSVELHFKLVDPVLQNNVVALRLIFALSFMKVDSLYFLQLVK